MSRHTLACVVAAAFLPSGCAVMEQYHFPQTQDKVPVKALLAYSEDHPNQVIKSIAEQKMFDGHTRYAFVIADTKAVESIVAYGADGRAE
jgi:hypothetical protein